MIRILLVDNDSLTKQYIFNSIDWEELNATVVAQASNGDEAFRYAIQYSPDIILSDIEMPICDGFEFISRLNSIDFPCKVIILTNKKDPDYIQKSIRLGVSDYLYKETSLQRVKIAIKKISEELEKERSAHDRLQRKDQVIRKYLQCIQSDFMSRVFDGHMSDADIIEQAKSVGISLCGPQYMVLLFKCEPDLYWDIIANIEQYATDYSPTMWQTAYPQIQAILFNISQECDVSLVMSNLNKRSDNVFFMLKDTVYITPPISSLHILAQHYKTGLHLSNCNLIFSKNAMVYTKDYLSALDNRPKPSLMLFESNVINSVKINGFSVYEATILQYIGKLTELLIVNEEVIHSLYRILFGAWMNSPILNDKFNTLLDKLELLNNITDLQKWLVELYNSFSLSTNSESTIIQKVKQYVEHNYFEKLNLNLVAKENYISPSYLSSIFNRQTGYNVNQWINLVRVEKAKELLIQGEHKHYVVATMVGYTDYKSFAKYFKKYTGKTAQEFKRSYVVLNRL